MGWIDFFEGLFFFIVIITFADCMFLNGLFTSAIAERIRGKK